MLPHHVGLVWVKWPALGGPGAVIVRVISTASRVSMTLRYLEVYSVEFLQINGLNIDPKS